MNCKILNYIKDKSELTKFEQHIINVHPDGLVSATATGPKGRGKTMFCFKTGTRIFQYLEGIHVDDAYLRALDHMKFTIGEMLEAIDKVILNTDLENIREWDFENKYRILISDDAGTHLGKYKFYTDVAMVDGLQARLDTIRDVTSCILMTTPAQSGLLSFIREYPGTKEIKILTKENGNTDYDRVIKIMHKRKKWAREGKLAYPKIDGNIYVHDWAYDEYKRRKRIALQKRVSETNEQKDFLKMISLIKKFNPNISKKEIIERLGLPQQYHRFLDS